MGRAEGEKGGDQWSLTDELWLQWPVLKCRSKMRPEWPIKRDEKLLGKEPGINLGSLTVKQTYSKLGMKLSLWIIKNTVNLIKQEV